MRLNFIIQGTPLLSWRNCHRILDQSKDKQKITVENTDISHICPGNHNSVKLNLSELDCQAATILRNSEWRLSTFEVGFTADISRQRCQRRECKIFQLRGIFPFEYV